MHDETNDTNGEAAARPFSDGRILVVAMKGRNDAGEAASSAVTTLAASLGLTNRVAVIDDEAFFDYSINRPHTVRTRTGRRRIVWPHVTLLSPSGDGEPLDPDMDPDDLAARLDEVDDSDLVDEPGDVPLFSLDAEREATSTGEREEGESGRDDGRDGGGERAGGAGTGGERNLAGDAELRVTGANGANLLVLFGHEPTLRWRGFMERVLELCEQYGVTRILLVGALLADVPHSRPIGVFVSSEHQPFRDEFGIGRSEYQGPTGVLGALGDFAAQRGIPSVSVWASVPHYASQPPSPKAQLAVVDKLEELLDVTIPRAQLIERAERWEDEVDAATGDDNEIAEYVDYLERAHDMVEAPEASGEAIAKEFERFLRQGDGRGEGPRGGQPGQGAGPGAWTGPVSKPGGAGRAGELGTGTGDAGRGESGDDAARGATAEPGDGSGVEPGDASADERDAQRGDTSGDERGDAPRDERSGDEAPGDET
ncbi:hypothetical protein GCM10011490_02840 [Pseudoclavibacter endophyticus]|uniref:PAC2 family protein n=1 Tax=Pseudoclavibacter endophyticus TaxID=1778590 RepID=A0A6H9WU37_9MICO|nr:PAC2 family protein [Pseudoclavibacter endophyticus]KAB1650185.1 PAC2 family protein [Pseudoclavibacter endophyticus]GGA56393.1 hypothetical protein GCM10011490_02840 [Pseudoclavibacter endophyticus]